MKRVKYLNNRDLLAQIHASKNTYCSYVAPEDAQYDLIVPNLKKVKFTSELLKRSLKLRVSNAGVRSVDKKGSFDEFLKTVKNTLPIKWNLFQE